MLNEVNTYKCEFRIGESTTHLITSLKDFLEKDKIIFNDLKIEMFFILNHQDFLIPI